MSTGGYRLRLQRDWCEAGISAFAILGGPAQPSIIERVSQHLLENTREPKCFNAAYRANAAGLQQYGRGAQKQKARLPNSTATGLFRCEGKLKAVNSRRTFLGAARVNFTQ